MKEATVYIPPDSEDYTGYSAYIIAGTSSSDLGSFYWQREKVWHKYIWATEDESAEDLADHLDFYEKIC